MTTLRRFRDAAKRVLLLAVRTFALLGQRPSGEKGPRREPVLVRRLWSNGLTFAALWVLAPQIAPKRFFTFFQAGPAPKAIPKSAGLFEVLYFRAPGTFAERLPGHRRCQFWTGKAFSRGEPLAGPPRKSSSDA